MTQEFHVSVTPLRGDDFLVRTERVAPGVPLAEEQVTWPVEAWLNQTSLLMNDPVQGLLRSGSLPSLPNLGRLAGTEAGKPSAANLVDLGQQLYSALFKDTLRDSWMTARGIAQHRQEILRLRLGLKDTRLPRLPWEVMHGGDRPLATGTDVIFSRYHSGCTTRPTSPLRAIVEPGQPLRILMVLAAPTDQSALELRQEALHLQEELQQLPRRLGEAQVTWSQVELTILDQPGREQLAQTLEHNTFHVFHYAGHSNLGAAGGNLYLVNSRTGLTETLSGSDLAGLLVNNGIRMAVFNSCRGSYTATREPNADGADSNLVEALVKRGIPAVLAMAERIPDDVALNLSRLFYRNLKQAYSIDLSLNRARQGLIASYTSSQLYWALPILYLHSEFDGYLVQPPSGEGDRLADLLLDDAIVTSQQDLGSEWEATLNPDSPFAADPFATAEFEDDYDSFAHIDRGSPLHQSAVHQEVYDSELDQFEPDQFESDGEPEPAETASLTADQDTQEITDLIDQLTRVPPNPADDRPLPAPPGETLLPEAPTRPPYSSLPDPYYSAPNHSAPNHSAPGVTITAPAPASVAAQDLEMYAELERMLSDAGKLTEAIAACNRAIQINPNDAEAFDRLGLALYQQGYLAEAIAAFHQAIALNPSAAEVYYHLGQALYEQGHLEPAIETYQRAIQLNPNLVEVYQSLRVALQKQGQAGASPTQPFQTAPTLNSNLSPDRNNANVDNSAAATSTIASFSPSSTAVYDRPRPVRSQLALWQRLSQKPWRWVGIGAASLALLLGGWLLVDRLSQPAIQVSLNSSSSAAKDTDDLTRVSTGVVANLATEYLNQDNIPNAKRAIEALLDRGALMETAAVLTPAVSKHADNPTVNFLMGRLVWQMVRRGDRDYSLEDARRYWETAVKLQPNNPLYRNALGFAYYTEGNRDRAGKTWFRSLELLGEQGTRRNNGSTPAAPEALTAYAGTALTLLKLAENQPPSRRAALLGDAAKLRQKVMTDDPIGFQPDSLANNWQWSEPMIRDWRSLQSVQN